MAGRGPRTGDGGRSATQGPREQANDPGRPRSAGPRAAGDVRGPAGTSGEDGAARTGGTAGTGDAVRTGRASRGEPGVGPTGDSVLVRIRDLAGRPRGVGFLADHQGTLLTSHEAVDTQSRLVLHAAGNRTCVVDADAVTPLPALALALVRTEGLGVEPLPLTVRERVEAGTYVRIAAGCWREARVLAATQVTYTGTDRFHLVDDALELAIGTAGRDALRLGGGAAGGPVLDADTGAVLGILGTALHSAQSDVGFAAPLPHAADGPLAELLARNAATVPAYGADLNLAGVLELTATSIGQDGPPGALAHAAPDLLHSVERADVARQLDAFAFASTFASSDGGAGERAVLGLVGAPGSGRTTELAALAARRDRAEQPAPMLWLRGADLRDADDSVADAVRRTLERAARIVAASRSALPADLGNLAPERLARLAARAGRPLLLLLDGPEEMPPVLAHRLPHWTRGTADWLRETGARLVVACREEYWEHAGAEFPVGLLHDPADVPRVAVDVPCASGGLPYVPVGVSRAWVAASCVSADVPPPPGLPHAPADLPYASAGGPRASVDGPDGPAGSAHGSAGLSRASADVLRLPAEPPRAGADVSHVAVESPRASGDLPYASAGGPRASVDGPDGPAGSAHGSAGLSRASADVLRLPAEPPRAGADVSHVAVESPRASGDLPYASAGGPRASVDGPNTWADAPRVAADVPPAPVGLPSLPADLPRAPGELLPSPVDLMSTPADRHSPLPPCVRLTDLTPDEARRARFRHGVPDGALTSREARHPLTLRLYSEVRSALPDAPPARPVDRHEVFAAYLDLMCLRIAVRLAAESGLRGTAVRRLAARVAGQVHEAARRSLGPGQGELDRESFEAVFPWGPAPARLGGGTGWASAVLTEGLLVPAGRGYRFAHEELADWIQGMHLDLDEALQALVHRPRGPRSTHPVPVPHHRVGPVVQALLLLGRQHSPRRLSFRLRDLVEALDQDTASWWAARLLARTLLDVPDATPYTEVLRLLADRVVAWSRGRRTVPAEFAPAFWTALPVSDTERLDLLRRLVPADQAPAELPARAHDGGPAHRAERYLDAAARLLAGAPAAVQPLLTRWFEDERPLPATPHATVATAAQALLHTHRHGALDDLTEALVDSAHQRADELLEGLAEDEPSALCRAVDRWAHDERPARRAAAVAFGLRAAAHVRSAADRELLRHAALAVLAGPADRTLHGGALALLVHDPGTRDRYLPEALRHFADGDPRFPPGALAPALATHPEPVLEAFRARLHGPDAAAALRALADVTTPDLAHRVAAIVREAVESSPATAGDIAAHVDRRLDAGPAARPVLLPLITGLLDGGPEAVRAALAGVLGPTGTPASCPLRRELLEALLAHEQEPAVLAAVLHTAVPRMATGYGQGRVEEVRDLVHRIGLLLVRTPDGATRFDRGLVDLGRQVPGFAALMARWLADTPDDWAAVVGPSSRRMIESLAGVCVPA
ncbi:trypsin-like peptidase domain-containing protein [Streptomyces sp. NK08204]|uniref:trypsin-like peptidase domain-containing protein n=1 Tax=Streptomyces sp. NK08204 TaxID=2873260 RepID=UPI001CEC0B10|nr:trypsin-like peptidase domain-containing protein [Streptomyces sp. NK08204]